MTDGELFVQITDILKSAPSPVQEALAGILISKLFTQAPHIEWMARYRRYLDDADIRKSIAKVRRERGRKKYKSAAGKVHDLCQLFEDLNHEYFGGMMARPDLGWSLNPSRTILGHYDPCHHVIVLSEILDRVEAPALAVKFVLFHEMLHLRYPSELRGAKRCVHTVEFKKAERQFPQYKEAKQLLNSYLAKL